ncbi:MAG TPA: RNA polymerase sigma factor [Thermoanaerobaculia bacterium]|nr:RNA polymerase sigma factor [Thermoanaerobaculia bacterium]
MASARREPEEHVDADEDRELLLMVRRGEPEGATGLFRKYSVPVFRYADRMLANRSEAEEVAQEVFLKMIARVEQYDGRASVASWLFAIAANASRDRLRRSTRRSVVSLEAVAEVASDDPLADEALAARERRDLVRKALAALSSDQREALVLARYHGLPYAEIAKTLAISEGAVKTRIFRAMEKLKDAVSQGGPTWNAVTP